MSIGALLNKVMLDQVGIIMSLCDGPVEILFEELVQRFDNMLELFN